MPALLKKLIPTQIWKNIYVIYSFCAKNQDKKEVRERNAPVLTNN